MTEAEIYAHTNITVALIAKTDYNRVQAWVSVVVNDKYNSEVNIYVKSVTNFAI